MLDLRNEQVHEDRVMRNNVVGSFCGLPIVTIDELNAEADDVADLQLRIFMSSGTSIAAEILPGEERCADGIIRRTTTAESVGYDKFHNVEDETLKGLQRVSLEDARKAAQERLLVFFRPNRATLEAYSASTSLPCLKTSEENPYALIME